VYGAVSVVQGAKALPFDRIVGPDGNPVPRHVEFVDGFPRTMTKNEIARHALRARGIGRCWDSTTKAMTGA
jgi:hypothetical protein